MALNNPIMTRVNDETLLILNNISNEKDWELSKTVRNVINSYIEEHNLFKNVSSD